MGNVHGFAVEMRELHLELWANKNGLLTKKVILQYNVYVILFFSVTVEI